MEQLAIPAEYIAGLGMEVIKNKIVDKIDEKKLQDTLKDYVLRQKKYNEICLLSEEIDFQGLVEYIRGNLIDDAYRSVFAVNSKERGVARTQVVNMAVIYSKADTDGAKRRVSKAIYDCIDIIKAFYSKGISKQDYILATEIVDAVHEDMKTVISEEVQTIDKKLDKISNAITSLSNGTIYSVTNMIQDASSGRLEAVVSQLTKAFEHMSVEHPLYPHYGYTWKNGNFISVPRTKEATLKYPPRYVFSGQVRSGDKHFTDKSIDLADYAYRHQIPLTMNVSSVKKFLGDIEDPAQYEAKQLIGKELLATPPAFPEAIPCSIMVKDTVYFEYVLIRMQEVLDDGTLVIGNKDQKNSHVSFNFATKMPSEPTDCTEDVGNEGEATFNVRIQGATNREYLNYARFMNALQKDKILRVHVLNTENDLFYGSINAFEYKTGFESAEEEIDFVERICRLEEYFHVNMALQGEISGEEYDTVIWLSNLISQEEVEEKWGESVCTGILDQNFRGKLIDMNGEPCMLSYVGTVSINLFGSEFEIRHMRTYKSAVIKDFEKLKKKVEVLDDGDEIKITFVPGEDNTAVETINIPEDFETKTMVVL